MTTVHPMLIETHGKQAYLFATGRRREAVGASYLVHAVTDWARDALGPSGTIAGGEAVEIVVATSGTVLAFVTDRARAVLAVRTTTRRVLTDAPGLGASGVVGEPFEWDSGGAPAAVAALFAEMAQVRSRTPGPNTRFPMLPITLPCPTSGLPVAGLVKVAGKDEPRSATAAAKLKVVDPTALTRLAEISGIDLRQLRTATRLLADSAPDDDAVPARIALVHADGNGLGGLVSRLDEHLGVQGSRTPDTDYARGYREFSEALDGAAQLAFQIAVEDIGGSPLVLPLVVGGDDLTFLADARIAPALTAAYLRRFVDLASGDVRIAGPVAAASGVGDPRLGAAAGMVITSAHFPFSSAYSLVDELVVEEAKRAKTALRDTGDRPVPAVSLAFHVQLDSISTSNDDRIDRLRSADALLTAGPFAEIVGDHPRELSAASDAWLAHRRLDRDLLDLAEAMTGEDGDGRRILSGAQLHELRARLRPHPAAADEYLRRLAARDGHWSILEEGTGSLFTPRDGGRPTTRFLDALTLSPFIGAQEPA